MHVLDRYIDDIEPRIKSIYEGAPTQEEPSLQEALSAYGWVLLDSWVAWRTLRFLLRETCIEEKVQEKWFQTPSSYTASQLKAAWLFEESVLKYIENNTGKKFKELIDGTIQTNRNACAHFNRKSTVKGADYTAIWQYFQVLSKVFLLYETAGFLACVCNHLGMMGYHSFQISFDGTTRLNIGDFKANIDKYAACSHFSLFCKDKNGTEFEVSFQQDGCIAKGTGKNGRTFQRDIVNKTHSRYAFFGNKGFYRDVKLFVDTVVANWHDDAKPETQDQLEPALA